MNTFADLRILDLGWIWAGPLLASAYAELGADVVKVESAKKLDPYRLRGVERDPRYTSENRHEASPSYHKLNRGKRSLTVDLRSDEGRELVLRLAQKADLLVENFSAGTLSRLGLGWEVLRERNPRLVAVSMSGGGQSPRWRELRAYALVTTALAGYESLVGYPGEPALGGPTFGIADPATSSFALVASSAALWRAKSTGVGCYLDVSGIESTMALLGAAFVGDPEHPVAAPALTLPTCEDDGWVVVVLPDEDAVRCLGELAGDPAQATDATWQELAEPDRLRAWEERLATWTRTRERDDLMDQCRTAGLPCAPVWSIEERDQSDLVRLSTLSIEHPVTGHEEMPSSPWGTNGTPSPAPLLGAHTDEVLREWLGMTESEIDDLRTRGVLD